MSAAEVAVGVERQIIADPEDTVDRWPLVQRYRPAGTWEGAPLDLRGVRVSVFEVLE